jgi:uncharacterized protein
MENTPFIFGKIATGDDFTDREKESAKLEQAFRSGINIMLISPRRWGKSSLVSKTAKQAAKKDSRLRFCFIDLYNVRTEEQFYQLLAQELIKAVSTKWEERIESTKKFIGRFIPKITYSPQPSTDFSISLDWKEVQKHPDDIIAMPELIAAAKKIKLVVCIDEFQNISEFTHPLEFQKKLRASWQQHRHVSYCLYGSKRNMLTEVFASPSMPFYKFGEILFLQKISEKDLVKFIQKRFTQTKKKISGENAALIATSVDCHPYYVQQLAQQSWLRSGKICSREIIKNAMEDLTLQLSLLFQTMTDGLSNTQVNFLHALIDNAEKLSSKEILHDYKLGTSANVIRIKDALIKQEIIDIQNNVITFLDPVYRYWLSVYYFKK